MKERIVTDRLTELSLMMTTGANATKLRNRCAEIVKSLKKERGLSKTDRVALMNQFSHFAKSPDPAGLIKEVLAAWEVE